MNIGKCLLSDADMAKEIAGFGDGPASFNCQATMAGYHVSSFDIGLSSHFLLMYTALGYDFHISAISEMLRVCRQVRIFPLCDLDSNASEMIDKVIANFRNGYKVDIKSTNYEFQKGANKLLIISN